MDKQNKTLLTIVSVIMALVILSCAGGVIYVVNLVQSIYSDSEKGDEGNDVENNDPGTGENPGDESEGTNPANLQEILNSMTTEGYCLTDYVSGLVFNDISTLYQEACVSIIIDVKGVGSWSWLGSGVCVASKGYETEDGTVIEDGSYIVTNYHVIEEYYNHSKVSISVYPNDYTNTERYGATVPYIADVLWSDSYLDMAIIYVDETLDWIRMKDRLIGSDTSNVLKTNEKVFVIGTPQDLTYQNTITKGSISGSSLNYSYTVDEDNEAIMSNIYEYLIPIQVSIMGGNSGGGLFDSKGYLIGQPTLGAENSQSISAINYAIPIYSAIEILNDLIDLNEDETDPVIKFYGLKDLDFLTIDNKEAKVMSYFSIKNFYGVMYTSTDLSYLSTTGLKVLSSNVAGIEKNEIISSVTLIKSGETEGTNYIIDCRNDLIFLLLKARAGDTLSITIKNQTDLVNILLA